MTDYERAMRSALKKIYPQSSHFACWFHFCQAVKRHINQLPGVSAAIRSNSGALEIYGKFLCLPLLPLRVILDTFKKIKAEAESYDRELFKKFLKYYERQWIQRVIDHSIAFYFFIIYYSS